MMGMPPPSDIADRVQGLDLDRLKHMGEHGLHHRGELVPKREEDWATGGRQAHDAFETFTHGDDARKREKLAEMLGKGKDLFDKFTGHKDGKRPEGTILESQMTHPLRHKPHPPRDPSKHHFGPPPPEIDACTINDKAVVIMESVHERVPELLPRVELYLGLKILILIPMFALALMGSIMGCRLWKQARRGYRPTLMDSSLQQPLYAMGASQPQFIPQGVNVQGVPMAVVPGPGGQRVMQPVTMMQTPDGQMQYAVNYPSLTQATRASADQAAAETRGAGQVALA